MELLRRLFLPLTSPDPAAFEPQVMFTVGELEVTSTVTTTWVIMAVLFLISFLATRNLKEEPEAFSLQNAMEGLVQGIDSLVEGAMGPGMKQFVPYIGTLVLYLGIANLVGIIPGRDLFNLYTPTADLNTTFALAAITFFNIHFFGIKAKGIGAYLKSYFEPMPFLAPLNVIGSLADPVSLSFRLFGNMIGGVVIMGLIYNVITIAVPAFASLYFDVFAGVLQAFIFTMLTMTYISVEME
ncbi:F0F1 ATP synthase subunit A [Halonatronum saccharophilum]|uniref:F0F1 ATP synthase subunit A n=1 Tax=Halonatronum saccharophilum TaxID=150060 RepID=UPI000481BDBA|nr:F0F1 ATP synthase subunit A [Halonatronum saccharophilum]